MTMEDVFQKIATSLYEGEDKEVAISYRLSAFSSVHDTRVGGQPDTKPDRPPFFSER